MFLQTKGYIILQTDGTSSYSLKVTSSYRLKAIICYKLEGGFCEIFFEVFPECLVQLITSDRHNNLFNNLAVFRTVRPRQPITLY